jgi:hypothetical protein
MLCPDCGSSLTISERRRHKRRQSFVEKLLD